MPNFTPKQQLAVDMEGSNIIVSAGAGSGKTTVLTARVLRKLSSGVGIDKLLILTFTKLAASSMKEKIRKEIKKNERLRGELKKLDSSYISTFDSYSLSLVRKYHYLLNVKRDINIIDSNLLKIKTKEFLEEIMDEEYQEKQEDFIKLINDYCIKDDSNITSAILDINDKLNLKYNKKEYLNNYVNSFFNEDNIKNNLAKYLDMLFEIVNRIDNYIRELSNYVDIDYLDKINNVFNPIINSRSYEEIRENLLNIKDIPNKPKNALPMAGVIKNKIVDLKNELLDYTRFSDTNELINSIKLTKPYIEAIIRIIVKLDNRLDEYKFNNDLYDFVDISKMAIKIVKENKDICEEIKYSFNEIMVDEYQDTSDLQEEFISLISNNNVYTVGDVKQSIYRFRNANPDIFRIKYDLYNKNDGGRKIDLLDNFRSRKEVVDGINLIFKYVMSELIGGADYVNSHQMIYGNKEYETNGAVNQNNNLEVYTYPYERGSYYSKDEIEAFIIACDIKEKVNNHYQVYDKDKKILRDATYSDFSILIDRSSSFDIFKKVFLYHQIPLSIYQDEKLTDSEIFFVIRNIFKLVALIYDNINNKEMEYSFLSIGRSFLFNYTDEELFDIVTNNNYEETEIFAKIKEIINNIESKSISMILDEVIKEFNIYEKLRRIPNILSNYVKLEYMYSLASNLNNMGYTFRDFDEFLEDVLNTKNEIKFSMNKIDSESTKIMTIHASKGLEYSICYFPGLDKKFNIDEIKGKILYNDSLGIVTNYYDEGMDESFYKELLKRDFYQNEVSEKIRLFYVAATRAKEKMIFIIPEVDKENEEYDDEIVSSDIRLCYRKFIDILTSIKSKLIPYTKSINIDDLSLTKKYNSVKKENLFESIKKSNNVIQTNNAIKINVIKKEESHFSKSSSKIFSRDEKKKMDFGTKMHYYLETLDLHNPDLSDIDSLFKDKIVSFLKCDLLKNVKEAKVYQEYEFTEETDNEEKHGIIDLMLEYPDHFDIIDYKLKNIDDEAYSKQLTGYKNYIEGISNKKVYIYLYSLMDERYQKL